MKIISEQVTKKAEVITNSTRYDVEYTISNHAFERCNASVYSIVSADSTEDHFIGSITVQHDQLSAVIPLCENMSGYIKDFEGIMKDIKKDIAESAPQK